jgi:hypothetical protein
VLISGGEALLSTAGDVDCAVIALNESIINIPMRKKMNFFIDLIF